MMSRPFSDFDTNILLQIKNIYLMTSDTRSRLLIILDVFLLSAILNKINCKLNTFWTFSNAHVPPIRPKKNCVFRATVSKNLGRVGIDFFFLSLKFPVKTPKNQWKTVQNEKQLPIGDKNFRVGGVALNTQYFFYALSRSTFSKERR